MEHVDPVDSDFIAEALPVFVSEAMEQIETIEKLLLELETDPINRDLLDALFRCAHTVKGSAGIFGLDEVVDFTHHVETLLDRLRTGEIILTPALSTLLLQCGDQMRALVAGFVAGELTAGSNERDRLIGDLIVASGEIASPARCAQGLNGNPGSSSRRYLWVRFGIHTFRDGMDPLAILAYLGGRVRVDGVACGIDGVPGIEAVDPESCHLCWLLALNSDLSDEELLSSFSFVREESQIRLISAEASAQEIDDFAKQLQEQAADLSDRFAAWQKDASAVAGISRVAEAAAESVSEESLPVVRASRSIEATGEDQRFIRVQADRLDAVINLLGELVIASAGASMLARQTRQNTLIEANLQIARLIEEIRNGTLQLRMVPIGETFSRFRRVVRDTAAELGKDVALQIVGGETELDKSVVERIADPLMHLVRNALDHGLETPEEREAVGKGRRGQIMLSACHESGSILIRIIDDGRGISRMRVLDRAWDRGLVERGVTPADADILKLIFEPGFSTAERVTSLSGRGVGMDVVRRNIEALRGSVTLSSTEGAGSTIEIRLPLTLAIIDGFLVGVGSSKFIFPLESVVEVIEQRASDVASDAYGRCVVELRGQPLPVISLRALYALEEADAERMSTVVIQAGGRRYGVAVDQLMGQHQTVIKPLGRMFRSLRGMSGSSILGTGEVALIFDVNSLGQLAAAPQMVTSSFRGTVAA